MTELREKIKTALDESRMLILGSQVLVGFQYRSVFELTFEKLPEATKMLELVTLVVMLVGIALLMSPGAYHRIVHNGEESEDLHAFTTKVMDIALLPLALALGADLEIATGMIAGTIPGLAVGLTTLFVALLFWYGISIVLRRRRTRKAGKDMKNKNENGHTRLGDKIEQVLLEARVVLPGAQALLGFQFVTMFMQGFESLPLTSKYVHLASLVLMALSIIFLMSPAAYHRIVERGEHTEDVHQFASWMLLAAMVPLPLGISGDFYVVVKKVTDSTLLAIVGSVVILTFFYGLWFGYTIYRRSRLAAPGVT
jgi:DMSO reductase anchor subunit